jgi:hypothetical protein
MLVPIVVDSWSTRGAEPVTTTSAVAEGRRRKSPVDVFPSATGMVDSDLANPCRPAVTLYVPGGRRISRYAPVASVTAVRTP